MDNSSEYRKRASEADARSEAADDPQLKRSWRECANSWRQMAELAARKEVDAGKPANDA